MVYDRHPYCSEVDSHEMRWSKEHILEIIPFLDSVESWILLVIVCTNQCAYNTASNLESTYIMLLMVAITMLLDVLVIESKLIDCTLKNFKSFWS